MNAVQAAIVHGSREQSGLWDIVSDIAASCALERSEAFEQLKREIAFIKSHDCIYLLRSTVLYSSDGCEVLNVEDLLLLPHSVAEFDADGPFYYLSNRPSI